MKGTIKDILNIQGVQGYIIAGNSNIQIKLPSKFNISDSKDRISRLVADISKEKNIPGGIIEIFTNDLTLVVFCSSLPVLIVITSNVASLPLVRITGKLVYANILKGGQ